MLGMSSSAAYQILGKPGQIQALSSTRIPGRPPAGRYTVASWSSGPSDSARTLTITSRGGRVIQIQFNSPKFATRGGVSVATLFADLRRRYPHMRVDQYGFDVAEGGGYVGFYIDSVRTGIAFTQGTQDDEATYEGLPQSHPETIIVHLPGERVLPTVSDPTQHVTLMPLRKSDYLPDIRAWFAGGPHRKVVHKE